MLAILVQRYHLNGDVSRRNVLLQLAQDIPAEHVWQINIERNSTRIVLVCQQQRIDAAVRDENFEFGAAREVSENACIALVVLDDQQHKIAGLYDIAVILDVVDDETSVLNQQLGRALRWPRSFSSESWLRRKCLRQIEREGAA